MGVGGVREGRMANVANSLFAQPPDLEDANRQLMELYEQVSAEQTRWDELGDEDPRS